MPFHPFCSQGQNEQNAANAFRTNHSYSRMVDTENAPIVFCWSLVPGVVLGIVHRHGHLFEQVFFSARCKVSTVLISV